MRVGDKVKNWVHFGHGGSERTDLMSAVRKTGTVIFINHRAGWYAVRYDFPKGSITECYSTRGNYNGDEEPKTAPRKQARFEAKESKHGRYESV